MISFTSPWLFILLPLPLVLLAWLHSPKKFNHYALPVPFFSLLKSISPQNFSARPASNLKKLLATFIWIFLITAAANPVWLGNPLPTPLAGRNIILALDLSGSMQTPDMDQQEHELTRLDVVKAEARKFISARPNDRLGLVLFGTKAYVQTPLTYDHQTVLNMLNDASIGLAGSQTAMGDAMGLAVKQLRQTPESGRILILLTDGGNNTGYTLPLDIAEIAKQAHIKIYTIGLGANEMVVPGIFGPESIHTTDDLDLQTLKQIAKQTGGLFFRAQNQNDLEQIYQAINSVEPSKTAEEPYRPQTPLYPYPTLLAFILLTSYLLLRGIRLWN